MAMSKAEARSPAAPNNCLTTPADPDAAFSGEYTPVVRDLDALVEAEPFVREDLARMGAGG